MPTNAGDAVNLPDPREGMIREAVFVAISYAIATATIAGCVSMLVALSAGGR